MRAYMRMPPGAGAAHNTPLKRFIFSSDPAFSITTQKHNNKQK